jgi:hypothetical protein
VEKIDGFNPEKIKDLAVRAQFDAIKRKDNKDQSKETSNGNGNPIIREKEVYLRFHWLNWNIPHRASMIVSNG